MKETIMENSNIISHFSERSMKYNNGNSWVTNQSVLESISSFLPSSFSKIVDLGAGTCVVSQNIFDTISGNYEIFAVDINESMLKKCKNSQIKKIVSDIGLTPFPDNYFDVVVTRQCLHYISDLQRVLKEIKRISKQNSTIILAQIVPFDSDTLDYWSKILKLRQPLRKNYYDSEMWINTFTLNGFQLINSINIITKSSVNDWIDKYNINNPNQIENMHDLFMMAPSYYKEKYHIIEENDDITYDSNWLIAQFHLNHINI